ncbi:unnamed protein product [Parascedosporium putredinis]|uniref:Histone chaperone domain-containing protein n=1 Tax=Parascedosporium putredinis TaxID=1442378 RepID=A0A9P1GYU2_9PEZI|nr:unnamed protein product [Parascedosporium putredinis]CAI7991113.1 unnamed protein product [Parascedosporium putredinis]
MSKYSYQQTDDVASDDLPQGAPDGQVSDNSYARPGGRNEPIPVVKDEASIEDPINESNADSDQQLERDEGGYRQVQHHERQDQRGPASRR